MALKNGKRPPFRKPAGFWSRLARAIRFRLVVPMMRSQHSPEHTARGVMIGLICACIPSPVGQMGLAFAAWVVARRLFKWDFSLIQGLAWTWTTNVFTAAPCYYTFFLTGQILLGRWDDLTGYDSFVQAFSNIVYGDAGFIDGIYDLAKVAVLDWGLAMYVGAVPWAAFLGWLGYRLGLRFVIAYRAARVRRWERRAAHYAELAAKRAGAASDRIQ